MHATTLLASLLALGSTTQALEFWQTFPKSPSCVEYPFVEEAKGLWDPQMEFCHNQPIPFKGFRFSNRYLDFLCHLIIRTIIRKLTTIQRRYQRPSPLKIR